MKQLIGMILVIAICIGWPGRLAADDKRDPISLFNKAAELAEAGKLKAAIQIWLLVEEDIPEKYRAVVQANLGMAYYQLNQPVEAWYHLQRYLAKDSKDAETIATAAEIEKELDKHHVKVTVNCTPADARVFLLGGGKDNGYACPFVYWFKPGAQEIFVKREGCESTAYPFAVSKTSKNDHRVELASCAAKPIAEPAKTVRRKGPAWWTWAAMGGGAALVAGGAVLNVLGNKRNDELIKMYPDGTSDKKTSGYNKDKYDAAYDSEVMPKIAGGWALIGVGGAALITGATFVILHYAGGEKTAPAVSFAPLPGGGAATFGMTF